MLRERLQRLRRSRAAPEEGRGGVGAPGDGPSLAERLRRVSLGRGGGERAPQAQAAALAEALGGVEIAPGVLLLERSLPGGQRHGQVTIDPAGGPLPGHPIDPGWVTPAVRAEPDGAAQSAAEVGGWRDPRAGPVPEAAEIVCLDTETSGLAGGTGTWAFVTGLLRGGGEGWRLRQYLLTRLDAEPAYLAAIASELAGAGLLISYNGQTFDMPLLATRFRLAGQADPLPALPHLDLLRPVRRAYGRVWPDCRLVSVEHRLLGFQRRDDLPGSEAPAAWLAWLRGGAVAPLGGVLRHNRWDLLSLAALVPRLAEVFSDPAGFAADVRAVAAYHQAQGRAEQALRLLRGERHRLGPAGLLDLARLHRRRGEWDQARAIWERLSAAGDAEARAELAKYHEHRTRDLRRALALAVDLPPGPLKERRCARLSAKLLEREGHAEGSLT